jgi:hypothetical protein
MASVTRVNGLRNLVGTVYADNCNIFLITVKIANATAVDLQAEDDAMDETVELILKEINPLAFYMPADNSGKIHVVMDKSINDAVELRTRIRNMSPVGANSINVTGTTVTAATSFTVA